MMLVTNFKRKALLVASVALMSASSPAFAGFEWKSNSAQSSAPAAQAPISLSDAPSQRVAPVEAAPVSLTALEAPAASSADNELVSGFGSDLPLMIALQQVVPAGYNISLDTGVSPDLSVSWTGGKPWKQVLEGMLVARELNFRLQDRTMTIGHFAAVDDRTVTTAVVAPVAKQPLTEGPNKADMIPLDMIAGAKESSEPLPAPIASIKAEPVAEKPADNKEAGAVKLAAALPQADAPAPVAPAAAPATKTVAGPVTAIAAAEATAPVADSHNVAGLHPRLTADSSWRASEGRTLKEVLGDWTKKEGTELYWSMDYDYRLTEDVAYGGSFENAVGRLLERFGNVRPQPFGELHLGEKGPRVLVVSSYDLPH